MQINDILLSATNVKKNNVLDEKSTIGENSREIKSNLQEDGKRSDSSTEEKKKAIIEGIEKASGKIEIASKGLEFSIHEETNQIMIKVVDNNTHKVIKEVPPEKILDMLANIIELSGCFVDERG